MKISEMVLGNYVNAGYCYTTSYLLYKLYSVVKHKSKKGYYKIVPATSYNDSRKTRGTVSTKYNEPIASFVTNKLYTAKEIHSIYGDYANLLK